MRSLVTLALALLILSSCGNVDRGQEFKSKKQNTVSGATAVLSTSASTTGFSSCFFMTKYSGNDAAFAQSALSAVQICPALTADIVKLKTNSSFPTTTRFCLIPVNTQTTFQETCFTVNGQQDVTLSTGSAIAVALVRETDLNAMLSYFHAQSSSYPAMAFATLR